MTSFIKRTCVWVPLVVILALAAGLYIGAKFLGRHTSNDNLEKIGELIDIIDGNYVDEVNIDSLLETSIPDILAKLDPHSEYISAADINAVNEELDGSFSGVGISFNMLTDTITVVEVIPGGPSERAGLLAGDRIVTINDSVINAKSWSTDKVIKNLKGPKGTKVKLGIKRNSTPKILTYEVTRGDVPVNTVDAAYMLDYKTGYIKVNKFGRTTYGEFLTALTKLRGENAQKYVIDLRGNGGGLMDIAILMVNEFLPAGSPIVSTRGRVFDQAMINADGTGSFVDEELVVLIDEFSASASEIFSGAIQDNDRGLIIGRRSFGKGLVQSQLPLADSCAVRLTVARYYTPSGRCIQKTYTPGEKQSYSDEVINRFFNGEAYNADSIHLNKEHIYHTMTGRKVYGGGGIMPDIFIPSDTSGITTYYINVINAGLIQKYAFNYADMNRESLQKAKNIQDVLQMLPADDVLLQDFAYFARSQGIMPRWYYINISRNLIVNQLKGLIARDALGMSAYYEIVNRDDKAVNEALKELSEGNAGFPLQPKTEEKD